jgi:MerR family transcriptional regulator, copper efflux regulator
MNRSQQLKPEMAEAKQQGFLNIGDASAASGVSAKMIRHYEQIKLIRPASRTFANYRIYSADEVYTLGFIKRARLIGFTTKQISALLSLWQNKDRSSAEVKKLALEHVTELQCKIREMQNMCEEINVLADHCHGDARPSCPILEGLALQAGRGNTLDH